jgi:hypothetical protein
MNSIRKGIWIYLHSCDGEEPLLWQKKSNFVNRVENLHLNNMPTLQWERNGYHIKDAHLYFRNNATANRMDFCLNITDCTNIQTITIQKMVKQKLKHVLVVWMWLLRDQTFLNLNTDIFNCMKLMSVSWLHMWIIQELYS